VRHGRLAVGDDRELVVRAGVAADRGVDGAGGGLGVALHERVVDLVDRALLEGALEHGVRVLALRHHHEPGRADVQPVHDALPLGGPGGRHPVASRGERADHGRSGPAG
jgi:hypothetical protein